MSTGGMGEMGLMMAPPPMFGDFEDEQEELMVQLAEIDKELEVLVTENQMYETCYQIKAQVRGSLRDIQGDPLIL